MRLIVRVFADKVKLSDEHIEIDESDLDTFVPELARKHWVQFQDHTLHMVEFEFPDEPEEHRFLRFGTDPRGMVRPIEIDLSDQE